MTSKGKLSVAGLQYLHQEGQREANIAKACAMIRAQPGHDIYVLPELASSGYGLEAFRQLDHLAEDLKGPSYEAFAALAKAQQCFISYGYPKRQPGGKATISAAVVDPTGAIVADYDKWHVCQNGDCYEQTYFAPGQTPRSSFEVNGVRIGICICYDIRFPEIVRDLAIEEGIHLLLHPGGWPRDAGFRSWHPTVFTRAIENGIYIMSINRAGAENGHSVFCPPYPDFQTCHPTYLPDREAEGMLVGKVDLQTLAETRKTYPLLQDRRADMYAKRA